MVFTGTWSVKQLCNHNHLPCLNSSSHKILKNWKRWKVYYLYECNNTAIKFTSVPGPSCIKNKALVSLPYILIKTYCCTASIFSATFGQCRDGFISLRVTDSKIKVSLEKVYGVFQIQSKPLRSEKP